MTSFIALERVMSFLLLKDITYAKKSNYWRDFFSEMAESWKKLKTSNMFLPFIVCLNQNRSAQVCELLSNNSMFVALNLIFFTFDLKQ